MLTEETKHLYTPAITHAVNIIGKVLEEDKPMVAFQLRLLIHVTDPDYGPEIKNGDSPQFTTKCLVKTLAVIKSGDVPEVAKGGRKRTRGGVFFAIAKDDMTTKTREEYFRQLVAFDLRKKYTYKQQEQ